MSKNSQLKLICFVSVSSVLFLSSCGPWCQKTLILSWFAFFLSLLCSFWSCGPWCQKTLILSWFASFLSLLCSVCLLVGLGVKKTLTLSWFSVSSVLCMSASGPWCQKTLILSWFALFLSLLCSVCLLVGLGVKKTLTLSWFALFLSLLCSFCLLVGLGAKKHHLKLMCFVSVSSVLFLSSCGPWCPWCQKLSS